MNTIQEYIEDCPQERQAKLQEIRECIIRCDKRLEEKISWGMPTFYYKRNIIHFALHKNHIGIYPGEESMEHFEEKLKTYKRSKGAFQIPHTSAIPKALLKEMVLYHLGLVTK